LNPSNPEKLKTKLVVHGMLSNHYDGHVIFVDTVTHIDASFFKEFLKPDISRSSRGMPGIKDAEVTITSKNESNLFSPLTEEIIDIYPSFRLNYYQGYYCDHYDKVKIEQGEKYILKVKYKDIEISAETIIPKKFDIIDIMLTDSLNISWENNNSHIYKFILHKYCQITSSIGDTFNTFSSGRLNELEERKISFGIDEIEERFKNKNYVYYFSEDITGKYKITIGADDINFYNYRKNGRMNIYGGIGLFGSLYILEKEFEIVENDGRYEVTIIN